VHAGLAEVFQARIRDVQEGRSSKPGLSPELRERIDRLADAHLARYAVDKLRRHSRILEPAGIDPETDCTVAYAQLMLAWDWAAWAKGPAHGIGRSEP